MTYFPNKFSTKILYQTFIVLSVITSSCNTALRSHIIDRKEQLQNPVLDIFCNNKRALFYFFDDVRILISFLDIHSCIII